MASLLILLSTLFLSFLLYCLLFDGKRRMGRRPPLPPGPRGWPVLGNLPQLGTKPHQTLYALSKVYGPLFHLRFGSVDVVVAASAAVATQFLRNHDVNFSNRPPNSAAEHIAYNYQDLVFAPSGPRWRMLRKLCALHLFSTKALDDLRPLREAEVAILARTLHTRARTHTMVNLGQALMGCTTNALSKAMLSRRVFVDEESKEAVEFKELVMDLMKIGVFNIGDFVPALRWFDVQGTVGKMKKLHQRVDIFLNKVIEEHQAATGVGGDLLSVLMRLKEDAHSDGGKLTNTNIKALFLNLFTAGTDTTASTTEWALSEMIRHPEILKKAQIELDSVVGQDRLVSEADLPNLPFLQAVVKETFRLHPSTPLSLPHMASEACEVNGYHIPRHSTLLVNVWAIARDPTVWADPLKFDPTRFLPGGRYEHVDVKGNDFEVIPFGAGRRICPGLSLGLTMVQFITATLLHGFDWALPEGLLAEKLDMEESYGITLQRAVPLMVHPIPRLANKAYEYRNPVL
ncbi:flavonoid 3'-monooxygenase-like [Asparagus officinalis]|uniref:flavonoid 3'-monooxygenase-like n=1 Tax=Asparagus officinalis TaxID=4686 RepID=UPI00098E0D1E|nr:flavonoid 3'-monooxygenase-like [Asparagus officinalis]